MCHPCSRSLITNPILTANTSLSTDCHQALASLFLSVSEEIPDTIAAMNPTASFHQNPTATRHPRFIYPLCPAVPTLSPRGDCPLDPYFSLCMNASSSPFPSHLSFLHTPGSYPSPHDKSPTRTLCLTLPLSTTPSPTSFPQQDAGAGGDLLSHLTALGQPFALIHPVPFWEARDNGLLLLAQSSLYSLPNGL